MTVAYSIAFLSTGKPESRYVALLLHCYKELRLFEVQSTHERLLSLWFLFDLFYRIGQSYCIQCLLCFYGLELVNR